MVLRNTYRNLKSENSQDNARKSKRDCTFMNSASEQLSYFGADACLVQTMQRCKHRDMSPEEFAELGHPGSTFVGKKSLCPK